MNLQHVLAAADESQAGRQAVRSAIDLAGRAHARVTVVRAIPVGAMAVAAGTTGGYGFAGSESESPAIQDLRQWIGSDLRAQSEPPPAELAVVSGIPGIEIRRLAEQREADLLVLGRKQRSQLARVLLGDTADLVARQSRIPCLFVPANSGPLRRMLVAVDGSEQGMVVLTEACSFAKAVGATFWIVTVETAPEDQPPAETAARQKTLDGQVQRVLEHEGMTTVVPSVEVRRGAIVQQILVTVDAGGPDVLAIGYHRGGLPGVLEAGSTARRLAHTAALRGPDDTAVKPRKSWPIRSILVPLDGSPVAEQTIPLALEIARVARSKVRLVLVHQRPPPPFYEEGAQLYVSIDLAVRKAERDYLRGLAAQLREHSGLRISSVTIDGPTEPALAKYVQDIGADMVAMTTHGRGGVRDAWLGSVADRLVRRLDVPVMVARTSVEAGPRPAPPIIRQILVPLDGSTLAETALAPAEALAGLFEAELMLVQIVPPLTAGSLLPVTFAAGYETEAVALQRKQAQDYLERLGEDLRKRGARVRAIVVVGRNVGEALINLANSERIDLLAIATHGRSGIERMMLGSVADKLIRAAGPPVLVVRPRKGR